MSEKSSNNSFSEQSVKETENNEFDAQTDSMLNYFSYDPNKKMILWQNFPFFSKSIKTTIENQAQHMSIKNNMLSEEELNNTKSAYNKFIQAITRTMNNNNLLNFNGNIFKKDKNIEEINIDTDPKQYLAKTPNAFNQCVKQQKKIKQNLVHQKSQNIKFTNFQQEIEGRKFYFIKDDNKHHVDDNTFFISFTNDNCDNEDTVIDKERIFNIPLYTKTPTITFNVKDEINQNNQQKVINKIQEKFNKLNRDNIPMFKTPDIGKEVKQCIPQNKNTTIEFNLEYTKQYLESCLSLANQGVKRAVEQQYYPFYYQNDLHHEQDASVKYLHEYALKRQKVYEKLGINSEVGRAAELKSTIELDNNKGNNINEEEKKDIKKEEGGKKDENNNKEENENKENEKDNNINEEEKKDNKEKDNSNINNNINEEESNENKDNNKNNNKEENENKENKNKDIKKEDNEDINKNINEEESNKDENKDIKKEEGGKKDENNIKKEEDKSEEDKKGSETVSFVEMSKENDKEKNNSKEKTTKTKTKTIKTSKKTKKEAKKKKNTTSKTTKKTKTTTSKSTKKKATKTKSTKKTTTSTKSKSTKKKTTKKKKKKTSKKKKTTKTKAKKTKKEAKPFRS